MSSIDMFPVIDCGKLLSYFNQADIPITVINRYKGDLTHAEGICNNSVKFSMRFTDDNHIKITAGMISRVIELDEDNYPL
jgi:hypothetical protein